MPIDKLFSSLNISASGLSAQRKKLDVISSNIANANTTKTEEGGPYLRKYVNMESQDSNSFKSVLRKNQVRLATSQKGHFSSSGRTIRTQEKQTTIESTIVEDEKAIKRVYEPNHPDADEEGFVNMPNINMISEMVDMISASRSYEANLSAIDAAKKMARAALEI